MLRSCVKAYTQNRTKLLLRHKNEKKKKSYQKGKEKGKKNEKEKEKKKKRQKRKGNAFHLDLGRDRTCNLLIRSQTPCHWATRPSSWGRSELLSRSRYWQEILFCRMDPSGKIFFVSCVLWDCVGYHSAFDWQERKKFVGGPHNRRQGCWRLGVSGY